MFGLKPHKQTNMSGQILYGGEPSIKLCASVQILELEPVWLFCFTLLGLCT